jgi:hypothetical protein
MNFAKNERAKDWKQKVDGEVQGGRDLFRISAGALLK